MTETTIDSVAEALRAEVRRLVEQETSVAFRRGFEHGFVAGAEVKKKR